MNSLSVFVQLIVGGLAIGSVYGLVALAHSMIWSGVRVVNFAQGEIFMIAASVSLMFVTGEWGAQLPFIPAALIGTAVSAFFGFLIYILVMRPTTKIGFLYVIGGCVGVQMLLQNIAILIWGSTGRPYPAIFPMTPVQIFGVYIVPQDVFVLCISLIAAGLLWLFLTKTKTGTAMRASSQNRAVAGLMGISHIKTDALTIIIASGLAGLAGILLAPKFFVTPQMGAIINSKAFTAAVLGGFGNIPGAVVGGLLLGIVENLAGGLLSSQFKDATSFIILILIMIFKPGGLFDAGPGRKA
ncbi:branched-chain amino acid ABC transporter permease [Breznakiella homolactica]|uniref:Branched-chain amino acid ABC transporter permease n=1 Tax=Breznakiella homolactica TaxID=2798577 RepID=A0A7T7XLK6_9SPIR|nr:branched-chain amino acid ABC transporter permease [Breznakiella homolactica]QQO08611.1 branched-chain amino acid ABC transporter permease [Breznakiella homolactica]